MRVGDGAEVSKSVELILIYFFEVVVGDVPPEGLEEVFSRRELAGGRRIYNFKGDAELCGMST